MDRKHSHRLPDDYLSSVNFGTNNTDAQCRSSEIWSSGTVLMHMNGHHIQKKAKNYEEWSKVYEWQTTLIKMHF